MEANLRTFFSVCVVAIAILFLVFNSNTHSVLSFSGDRPTNLGITEGKFAPCAATPNCVSSQSKDPSKAIAAISFTGEPGAAMTKIKQVIQKLPRTKIISENQNYLYAESSSRLMGFVDDLELWLDPTKSEIAVRSASRLGESDLGVNRQRIEQIRIGFSSTD